MEGKVEPVAVSARFEPAQAEQLEELRQAYGASSLAGAMRRAVSVAHAMSAAKADGWSLILERDGDRREVILC